jgi:hypothetical protein
VVADRDARIERLGQIRGDREYEQCVGTGRLEVACLANGRIRRRPGQPGDDRQVRDLIDDLEHPDLLVVREVRPLAGVDVDRERDRALVRDPADVRAEARLIDAAVGMHREDGGRDQPVEIKRHRSSRVGAVDPVILGADHDRRERARSGELATRP